MALISLYICSSEDGFIADKSGGVGWIPMNLDAQKNYEDYYNSIDMVIMGSRSFAKVKNQIGKMDWPYAGKISVVFTKQSLAPERDDIKITAQEPHSFVENLKTNYPTVKKVWLMGGAELTKSFAENNLIDEVVLFTVPKKIMEGIPLSVDLASFNQIEEGVVGDFKFKRLGRINV